MVIFVFVRRNRLVAQSVEQRPFKAVVPGSNPGWPRLRSIRFENINLFIVNCDKGCR